MIGFKALHQRIKAQEVQTKAHQGIKQRVNFFFLSFFDDLFVDLEPWTLVQDFYFCGNLNYCDQLVEFRQELTT
jgi:hypothetical protein